MIPSPRPAGCSRSAPSSSGPSASLLDGRPSLVSSQELAAESPLDAKFAFYAVKELREALRRVGSDLVVRCGDAGVEVPRLARASGASYVFHHSR